MFDWADYITEQYEDYMAQNCICDRSEDPCPCMKFEEFEHLHILSVKESYADSLYEEQQMAIECQF
jgi:hypothetical protein